MIKLNPNVEELVDVVNEVIEEFKEEVSLKAVNSECGKTNISVILKPTNGAMDKELVGAIKHYVKSTNGKVIVSAYRKYASNSVGDFTDDIAYMTFSINIKPLFVEV